MTLTKINILEYALREGGGGHSKAYSMYAFINVDNCERPLSDSNDDVFNPFAFTNCVCIGLAVFAFKALEIPCLFEFSGGKTQKCKYYY